MKTKGEISLQSVWTARHGSLHRNWPLSSSSLVVTHRKFKAPSSGSLVMVLDLNPEQHHNHEPHKKHLAYASYKARRASCTAPPFIWWRRGNQKVNREASGVQFNRDGSFFSIPSCKSLHNSSFQTQEQGPACMTSWDASLHTVEAGVQSLCNLMDGVCFCKYRQNRKAGGFSLLNDGK